MRLLQRVGVEQKEVNGSIQSTTHLCKKNCPHRACLCQDYQHRIVIDTDHHFRAIIPILRVKPKPSKLLLNVILN